jgi:hypothetical protein
VSRSRVDEPGMGVGNWVARRRTVYFKGRYGSLLLGGQSISLAAVANDQRNDLHHTSDNETRHTGGGLTMAYSICGDNV